MISLKKDNGNNNNLILKHVKLFRTLISKLS